MPINIYSEDENRSKVAWLCDDNWRLPDQAEALTIWLETNGKTLPRGRYIADIGFCQREDALGGGAAFEPETLRLMADLGISLFLSEYPGSA